MPDYPTRRPYVPGDSEPPYVRPEIIAAEERILTHVNGLLTCMRQMPIDSPEAKRAFDGFMAHQQQNPLAHRADDPEYIKRITYFILPKLDPDANRIFMEVLRAAWERQAWYHYYQVEDPHAG